MPKTYKVTWGPYSEVVEARDEPEAFARFADKIGFRNPDVERFPKKHERIIEEIHDAPSEGPDQGPGGDEGAPQKSAPASGLGGPRGGQGPQKGRARKAQSKPA